MVNEMKTSAVGFSANEDRLLTSMTVQALNLFSLETLNLNKQLFVLMEEHLPHHRVSSQVKRYHTSFWLEYRLCSMLSELFSFFFFCNTVCNLWPDKLTLI